MVDGVERPAWSRPPFEPGNELAVTHGAWSVRKLQPAAAKLLEGLRLDDQVAYLRQPAYGPALAAWAQAEARVMLIEVWVDAMPMQAQTESKQGQTSPLELLRKWEATASTHRARLGLDPLSRARLGRDVAATKVDLAVLLTQARSDSEEASDA